MGQIFRRGQSGQLYRTQIAGLEPTVQELEKFRDTVAKRGDTLILGDQPQDVGDNPPGSAFGRGFSMGIDQTQAMFGRALQSVGENIGFGGLEEYGREVVRHNEAQVADKAEFATRLEDVSGIGSGLTYFGETLGQGVATLLPTALAAVATRGATLRAGMTPQQIQRMSFSAGAATNYPILFGENLLEQDRSVEQGILPHVNDGAAALFALPATFLDTFSDRLVLGLGAKVAKPLLTKKVYQSVTGAAARRFGAGAIQGAMAEVPTEIGQSILTRIQAGKPIDDEEAFKEYIEVGVAAGIVGGNVRGTIDTVKGDKTKEIAAKQLEQDQNEEHLKSDEASAAMSDYDVASNRASNLEELTDPQLRVADLDPIQLNDENIPVESRASVISGINKELESNFLPVKLAHLAKPEQKKIRDLRRKQGAASLDADVELEEVESVLGAKVANREARKQKPLTFKGTFRKTLESQFQKPDGFRWSQYEKAVRLAIAQTRNNEGKVVENANVSIQDIMKISNINRAGAAAIRRRMLSEGVIEEYKRNKYAATVNAESKAKPLRELEQRISELQTSIEAAETQIRKEENKIAKFERTQPEKFKKAIAEIEDARSRITESQTELDGLARVLKKERAARKAARSKQGPQLNTEAQNRARTRRDEAIRVTSQFENNRQQAEEAVKKRMKEVGIDQDLGAVNVVAMLDGPEQGIAQGSYNPSEKIISIATAMHGLDQTPQEFEAHVMGVTNHELLHALFDLGLFTQKEWATLTKAVKTRKFVKVNPDGSTDLREYTFYDRAKEMYGGFETEQVVVEEAVAEMFRLYAGGQIKVVGPTKSLFDRIIDFFKAVMRGFEDAGFTSPEQIFESIDTGKIASTENRARVEREGAALPDTETIKQSTTDVTLDIVERAQTEEELEEAVTLEVALEDAKNQTEKIKHSIVPVRLSTRRKSKELSSLIELVGGEKERLLVADVFKSIFDPGDTDAFRRTSSLFLNRNKDAVDAYVEAVGDDSLQVYEYTLDNMAFLLSLQDRRIPRESLRFTTEGDLYFEQQALTGADLRNIRAELYEITQKQLEERGKQKGVRDGYTVLYRIGELREGEAMSFTTDPSLLLDPEYLDNYLPWVDKTAPRLMEKYLVENPNILFHMDAILGQKDMEYFEKSEHEAVVFSQNVRKRDARSEEAQLQDKKARIVNAVYAGGEVKIPFDEEAMESSGVLAPDDEIRYSYLPKVPHIENVEQHGVLRNNLLGLLKDGENNRFWYRNSAASILKIAGGDIEEARKLAGLIAKTSQQTKVVENMMVAVKAYYQHKSGQPMRDIKLAKADDLQEILDGGEPRGLKINPFYKNLMKYIDPENYGDTTDVTIDLWMQRAFGYTKTGSPTKAQIEFITAEVERLADEFGYENEEVQAAIWVAYKSQNPERGKPVQKQIFDGVERYPADDYVEALGENLSQISLETRPSVDSNHMPEVESADPALLAKFHVDMSEAFLNEAGADEVALFYNIISPDLFEAPGYYEGAVSPGTQVEIASPTRTTEEAQQTYDRQYALDDNTVNNLDAYAATVGLLLKQDAVGWHRPFFKKNTAEHNGIEIRLGRPLTFREQSIFAEEMFKEFGHDDFGGVATRQGLRVIHWPYMYSKGILEPKKLKKVLDKERLAEENKIFREKAIKAKGEAIKRLGIKEEDAREFSFYAETGYIDNDWTENLNGEGYIEYIRQGRPDVLGESLLFISKIQERVAAVEQIYSTNHGWTVNQELNSIYQEGRTTKDIGSDLGLSEEEISDTLLAREAARTRGEDGTRYSIRPGPVSNRTFESIPNSSGDPIFGTFRSLIGDTKRVIMTRGRHTDRQEDEFTTDPRTGRRVYTERVHGLEHISGENKRHTGAFDAFGDGDDGVLNGLEALFERLETKQFGTPKKIPFITEGPKGRQVRFLNENKVRKEGGIYMIEVPFPYGARYPVESGQIHLLWFGEDNKMGKDYKGNKRQQVMRLILGRAFISRPNEVLQILNATPTREALEKTLKTKEALISAFYSDEPMEGVKRDRSTGLLTLRNQTFNIESQKQTVSELKSRLENPTLIEALGPDFDPRDASILIPLTAHKMPEGDAFKTMAPRKDRRTGEIRESQKYQQQLRTLENQFKIEEVARGNKRTENRENPKKKFSVVPTHPTVGVNPNATTQIDNARGVHLYGKSAEFLAKVLEVPIKAINATGLFGEINAKETTDALVTKLQDSFLPVGQFLDEIRKAGFEVADVMDAYLVEEEFHNKTGYMLRRANEIFEQPIAKKIKGLPVNAQLNSALTAIRGVDGKGFFASMMAIGQNPKKALAEAYLFAKHAKERNEYIRQIDPSNTAGSGMTDIEADEILATIASFPPAQRALESLSNDVQDLVKATTEMNIVTGLEPDRQAEVTYVGTQNRVPYPQYQNYVPLKGFLEVDPEQSDAEAELILKRNRDKYGAKGQEYIAALGRGDYPTDILVSLFNQHQRAIDRGQRNLVGQAFFKLIDDTEEISTTRVGFDENERLVAIEKTRDELALEIQNNNRIPEAEKTALLSRLDSIIEDGEIINVERVQEYRDIVQGVAEVGQRTKSKRILSKKGYVKKINFVDRDDPNTISVKFNGEEVAITLTDARIAKALKGATGLGPDNTSRLVRGMTTVNRFLSSINTSYNPEFFITNFIRDIATGLTNVKATELDDIAKDVAKGLPSTLKNLSGIIRSNETNELSQIYKEFLQDGGQSALNMVDSLEQQIGKMDAILGDANDPKLVSQFKKGVDKLTETPLAQFVENYNSVIENAIRVSTYKTLRERGFTRARAGSAARNVTVNFSKGGDMKILMNSLYLFYNASIQGSFALMSAAVRSKKVQKIWLSAVAAGFLIDQLNALFSGEDEDQQRIYDKIPDYVLEHNVIITLSGLGGREYLAIPMPYGLNFAVNMGRSLSRRGRGAYTNGEFINSFFGTFVDAVNPIGGTESLGNFVFPTVLDPFVDTLLDNEDFAKKPVYKEGSPFGLQKPDSQLYWSTTSPIFKNTADFLNTATGGSSARSGLIDWSPDVMEYWYGFLTGGVGRFVERSGRFAFNVVDDPASLFSEEGIRQVPFVRKVIGSVSSREDTARFIAGRDQILTVEADLKDAIANQDMNRVKSIRSRYAKELKLLGRMKSTNNMRNRLIRRKAQIAKNPRIPQATKQKLLDRIDEQLQKATQRGNLVVSELYR